MLSWLFYTSGVVWLAAFDYNLSGKKKVESGFLGFVRVTILVSKAVERTEILRFSLCGLSDLCG
ncbi:MAG: hypothetical protein HKUEN02_06690 [Anaerolineaceae bacterium]|nr:MAG: hypothetical protein HKUEN02_06690 [Anaerolineaceae bacterium]